MSKVVSTEDGSITWFDQETGELYHNRAGAFTEAWKNYIEPCQIGALIASKNKVSVFDVCFGLGYNSYLFLLEAFRSIEADQAVSSCQLNVYAVDKDPQIVEVLPDVLADRRFVELPRFLSGAREGRSTDFLCRFGKTEVRLPSAKDARLTFDLVCDDLRLQILNLIEEGRRFDFIFHDGFSPRKVPELWTEQIFAHYVRLLEPNGKILTYSASAAVRGALQSVGLEVRRTEAVGGKSGGTIAGAPQSFLNNPYVFSLTEEQMLRLKSRSAIPYRDASLNGKREEIIAAREMEMRNFTE